MRCVLISLCWLDPPPQGWTLLRSGKMWKKKIPEVTVVENAAHTMCYIIPIVWWKNFHIYGANVSILIVWWRRIPFSGATVAIILWWPHSKNWLRLDWRLNPYCCYNSQPSYVAPWYQSVDNKREINGTLCLSARNLSLYMFSIFSWYLEINPTSQG